MDKIRVILDTDVLYAGLYSSEGASFQILRAIERGQIQIILSTTLLFEYEDVVYRKDSEPGLSERQIEAILNNLCRLSVHQKIYFLWRPVLQDPKDDHILEVAIASQTNIIVTHTIRDFKGIDTSGIRTITPMQLLKEIK
ncbi:MAG: putative toxin-antitoxin system toxin component, PIN family [bacterium]